MPQIGSVTCRAAPDLAAADCIRLSESRRNRLILLSAHSSEELVTSAFQAGVRGYVVKTDGLDDLVRAIREISLAMPRVNGLDAARDIREVSPSTQVIILSGHCTGDLVKRAFRAGARGYVVKSDRAQELVRAIREVANGGIYLSPGASRSVVEGYLPDSDR